MAMFGGTLQWILLDLTRLWARRNQCFCWLTSSLILWLVVLLQRSRQMSSLTRCTGHGLPEVLKSDNGSALVADVVQKLCERFGIKKVQSAPGSPRGNSMAELAVRDIMARVKRADAGTLQQRLREAIFAHNTTPNSKTGVTPYLLHFGRPPRFPLMNNLSPAVKKMLSENVVEQTTAAVHAAVQKWRSRKKRRKQPHEPISVINTTHPSWILGPKSGTKQKTKTKN